jgi:hypothetical protein
VYSYDVESDYTITIEPEGGGDYHGNSDFKGPDAVEPNDSREMADTIDDYRITGYACEGEDDWYVLDGQEGRNPTFILTFDDNQCDIDVEVFSDSELAGSMTGSSSPEEATINVDGTCYLRVYAFDGEGDYTIEIQD